MDNFIEQRQLILQQMAQIDQMEYGSLKAEYRQGVDPDQPLGPYYKHQVWQEGRNHSQRVSGAQAGHLRQSVEGRQQFEQLAQQYIELTVQHTRRNQTSTEVKKKRSRRRPVRKPSPKSKPLPRWPRPG